MDLGSQKPSQLLRKMRELASNCQASETTVSNLWLARLPTSVRVVLAAIQDQRLDSLVPIADKIIKNTWSREVASASGAEVPLDPMTEVLSKMNTLALEVATLRNEVRKGRTATTPRGGGPRSRDRHQQHRWRSPRMTRARADWLYR